MLARRPTILLAMTMIVSVMSTACAELVAEIDATPVPCDQLNSAESEAAVLILADGRSPALDRLVRALAQDASGAFAGSRIGFDTAPGQVLLATYDELGRLDEVGRFTLAGVGPERVRRMADAARQAECLVKAVEALPEAAGGHLLRALPTAAAIVEPVADQRVIVATGLGRARGDGFTVAETELRSAESRRHVIEELARVGFLPNFGARRVDLLFLAPGEDVESGLVAGDVTAFAGDLCARLQDGGCRVEEVLP